MVHSSETLDMLVAFTNKLDLTKDKILDFQLNNIWKLRNE